ncbi:hypothetical protein cd3_054 [Carnobacterium phage cd3]|uniref:Uncharacterized protein n=2 Tax=Carnodivirus TaxID=3044682 RepID=A0AAE7SW82_9CAUD|nr:hypothetical protein PQD68_gp054 [Carnobacterium phage cd2]YP_010676519.1 hypothetical protein PQD69_gp053 [Carnobacterium phage cd4]QXP45180.1 hypothetical protein cd2_054 [Carnobacterium phage cd2]QXP45264.1 hypothetical protein cd3_054 [Carnobacterium phage cd3]QXP45348.1 hypothetical protein cd4_053 [Carnobacterium phage cd4]
MIQIDETKNYKFSEIVRMLEDKELPEGTVLENSYFPDIYEVEETSYGFTLFEKIGIGSAPVLNTKLINFKWTIKLPKEGKYYLKAPSTFSKCNTWVNLNTQTHAYFLGRSREQLHGYRTRFTQSEIDAMPFDTNFFEKIKVEEV